MFYFLWKGNKKTQKYLKTQLFNKLWKFFNLEIIINTSLCECSVKKFRWINHGRIFQNSTGGGVTNVAMVVDNAPPARANTPGMAPTDQQSPRPHDPARQQPGPAAMAAPPYGRNPSGPQRQDNVDPRAGERK